MADGCRLLVRKLPSFLRPEDKESLLKFFGAIEVTVMAQKGQMRNCAFATFSNPPDARMAMTKLHQLNAFGSHLVVVYATPASLHQGSVENRWKKDKVTLDKEDNIKQDSVPAVTKSSVPQLTYEYPSPTQSIISNMANAIAAVPVLYTQVLHLMNKLNLPPPFGQPLPGPELPTGRDRDIGESELDTSGDEGTYRNIRSGRKRRRMPRKRNLSLKQLKESLTLENKVNEESVRPSRRIEMKVPQELLTTSTDSVVVENVYTFATTPLQAMEVVQTTITTDQQESHEEHIPSQEEFITYNELQLNRLTTEEMKENGIFKKFSKGEPSMRLYIKNLSKQVTEKDLTHIYGRYIDWTSDTHKNSFDVRVMQQGRMKGQAFIGLPSEEIASRALTETLGYKLYDRPIVVQFARSTKAKEKLTW